MQATEVSEGNPKTDTHLEHQKCRPVLLLACETLGCCACAVSTAMIFFFLLGISEYHKYLEKCGLFQLKQLTDLRFYLLLFISSACCLYSGR